MMDLTDGTGSSVWPITVMSYLLIDAQYSPTTCHVREAVVEFWLWFYTSPVVAGLIASRQYAPVPSIVLTELDVVDELSTQTYCLGALAWAATTTITRIIGASSVSFTSVLFANAYQGVDPAVLWTVQTNTDEVSLQRLVNAEIDIAFINPSSVDQVLLQATLDSSLFDALPTYLTAPALAYNPQITSSVNIADYTVTMTMGTAGLILFSCIIHWNHPRVLLENPWLAALLPPFSVEPVPLTKISGCGKSLQGTPVAAAILSALETALASVVDNDFNYCVGNFSAELLAAFYTCQNLPAYNLIYVADEASVPPLVLGKLGSLGAMLANSDSSYGYVQLTDYRDEIWTNTSASLAGMAACASDTFNLDLLSSGVSLGLSATSSNPLCYRPTQQVLTVFRRKFSSAVTDTSACDHGLDVLEFLQWFFTHPNFDVLTNSVNEVRVNSLSPDIEASFISALNAVVCDQVTLLVTIPVKWSLTGAISTFVYITGSLGLLGCIFLSVFVTRYHHHPVIRSASGIFLQFSIAGVALLFISGFLLVAPVSIPLQPARNLNGAVIACITRRRRYNLIQCDCDVPL